MTPKSIKIGRKLTSKMAQPEPLVTSDWEEPNSNLGRYTDKRLLRFSSVPSGKENLKWGHDPCL